MHEEAWTFVGLVGTILCYVLSRNATRNADDQSHAYDELQTDSSSKSELKGIENISRILLAKP